MSEHIKDGGPAFPRRGNGFVPGGAGYDLGALGMSLRDYFAAGALQGTLANSTMMESFAAVLSEYEGATDDEKIGTMAKVAYAYADAMLAARSPAPTEDTEERKT